MPLGEGDMQNNMQEYWVNVYDKSGLGPWHKKKPFWTTDYHYGKVLYRLHVKMKPVKIKSVKRTINNLNKFDW